jgi:hypothetical protein
MKALTSAVAALNLLVLLPESNRTAELDCPCMILENIDDEIDSDSST